MCPATMSVIVPTCNRPALLAEALSSVAGQRGLQPGEIEVVVVNDGQADITAALEHARQTGLRVRQAEHTPQRGLPAARNAGLRQATGEYLAFLDDDDVLLPEHARTALEVLHTESCQVAYTGCLLSRTRVDPQHPVADGAGETWNVPFSAELLTVTNLLPVHTAVLRRDAVTAASFDATLPALEDWDFWLRLARQGMRFRHTSAVTAVYHRGRADSMLQSLAQQAEAIARLGRLVRTLWHRWPSSDARVRRWRLYSGLVHWSVLDALTTRRRVHPEYYLRSVRALAAAWHDQLPETALPEQLEQAVCGDGQEHCTDVAA